MTSGGSSPKDSLARVAMELMHKTNVGLHMFLLTAHDRLMKCDIEVGLCIVPLNRVSCSKSRCLPYCMPHTNNAGASRTDLLGIKPSFCEKPQRPPPMAPRMMPQVTQRTRRVLCPCAFAAAEAAWVTSLRWCTKTRPAWRPSHVCHAAEIQPSTPSGSYTSHW